MQANFNQNQVVKYEKDLGRYSRTNWTTEKAIIVWGTLITYFEDRDYFCNFELFGINS